MWSSTIVKKHWCPYIDVPWKIPHISQCIRSNEFIDMCLWNIKGNLCCLVNGYMQHGSLHFQTCSSVLSESPRWSSLLCQVCRKHLIPARVFYCPYLECKAPQPILANHPLGVAVLNQKMIRKETDYDRWLLRKSGHRKQIVFEQRNQYHILLNQMRIQIHHHTNWLVNRIIIKQFDRSIPYRLHASEWISIWALGI